MSLSREKGRWLTALLVVAALAALTYAFSDVVFQTNDDNTVIVAASGGIAGTPEAANGFTSYGYGWMLSRLYGAFPAVPWHGLLLSAAALLSLTALLRGLLFLCWKRGLSPWLGIGCFAALYAGVGVKFLTYLQFTAVPGYCAAAALCLWETLPDGKRARRFDALFGLTVLCFALLLRPKSGLLALPLPLAAAFFRILQKKQGCKTLLVCSIAALLFAAGTLAGDAVLSRLTDPDWEERARFDEYSAFLLDYHNTDEAFRVASEAAGWTPELCASFRNWEMLFDKRFNADALETVADAVEQALPSPSPGEALYKTLSLLKNYREFSWNALAYAGALLLSLVCFFRRKRWLRILPGLCAVGYVMAVVFVFYGLLSRFPDRVAFVCAFPAYALTLALFLDALEPFPRRKAYALLGLAAVLSAGLLSFALQPQDMLVYNNPGRENRAEATRQVNAYAAAHPDVVFVTDVTQNLYAFETGTPPVNLIEWCSPLLQSSLYQEKFRLLGYPEGFDTLNLADENVRLLLSYSSLSRLIVTLRADGLIWDPVEVDSAGQVNAYRLEIH